MPPSRRGPDPGYLVLVGVGGLFLAVLAFADAAESAAEAIRWAGVGTGSLAEEALQQAQTATLLGWIGSMAGGAALLAAGYVWHARMVGAEVARALAEREAAHREPVEH